MSRAPLLLVAACLLATSMVPLGTAGLPGVDYELFIACPETASECPLFAEDGADAMGAPALAVDPDRPEHMIIASLHGSADDPNAPSNKSRDGQAFTTFTSQNEGRSWADNPFTPPDGLGGDARGEHPALTIDPYGHVFIGSLYSVRDGNAWRSVIAAQKFLSLSDINSNQDGSYNVQYLGPVQANNTIQQLWFEYNRVTDNMTMVWHETAPREVAQEQNDDGSTDVLGLLTTPSRTDDQPENRTETPLERSRIGVVWTSADVASDYRRQPFEQSIAPCDAATNPVIAENWLYIGCRMAADEGAFLWDTDVEPGDIVLFRMHPDGGVPQYLGPAPVSGGAPKIGVRSDGRIALMTTDVENGTLRLDATFGQYNERTHRVQWGKVQHHAGLIPTLPDGTVLLESNIQDMIYREFSGVIQIILKRYADRPDEEVILREMDAFEPELFKSIIAIDEQFGVLAYIDLEIGSFSQRSRDDTLLPVSDEAFNDPADDFLQLPPAPHSYQGQNLGYGYQREFFAVGSYGIVVFAELIEKTNLRGPLLPQLPPPPPPPTPAPAPASGLALAGAGALSATAIITGASTAVKRKHVSGAGKKKRP